MGGRGMGGKGMSGRGTGGRGTSARGTGGRGMGGGGTGGRGMGGRCEVRGDSANKSVRSYMCGHLILNPVSYTTLYHFVTATWALGPGMASAPTSHLEPWISL